MGYLRPREGQNTLMRPTAWIDGRWRVCTHQFRYATGILQEDSETRMAIHAAIACFDPGRLQHMLHPKSHYEAQTEESV